MKQLLTEIKLDFNFIKNHTLQPKWFKVLKVFLIVGFLAGYAYLFGWIKCAIFFACFILLSSVLHFIYRSKTKKWTASWLDFRVTDVDNQARPTSIGKVYYAAIGINTLLSILVSQR